LFELIQKIQESGRGDEEVVATISRLIDSGRVVLSNAFGGSAKTGARKTSATDTRATGNRSGKLRFAR
jgi:hypothetical protein